VKTWQDKAAFAETAKRLVGMFQENFKRFEAHVDATSAPPSRRCPSRPERKHGTKARVQPGPFLFGPPSR
jgi:hypothetical protein